MKSYLLPTSAQTITCWHCNWMLQSSYFQWGLEHSIETLASYFPSSSWHQITSMYYCQHKPQTKTRGGLGMRLGNKSQLRLTPILHFSLWWVWSTTLILISCLPPRRAPEPPWMETPSTSLSAKVLLTLPATQMYIWYTSPLLRDDPIHDTDRNGLQPQARGLPTQDRHHVPTGRGTQPRACVSLREKIFNILLHWLSHMTVTQYVPSWLTDLYIYSV